MKNCTKRNLIKKKKISSLTMMGKLEKKRFFFLLFSFPCVICEMKTKLSLPR